MRNLYSILHDSSDLRNKNDTLVDYQEIEVKQFQSVVVVKHQMLSHWTHVNWRIVLGWKHRPYRLLCPPAVLFLLPRVTLHLEDRNSHKNLHTDDSGCFTLCLEEFGWLATMWHRAECWGCRWWKLTPSRAERLGEHGLPSGLSHMETDADPLPHQSLLLSLIKGSLDSNWGASLLCSPFAWQRNKAPLSFSFI